jgi:hypothetical protein
MTKALRQAKDRLKELEMTITWNSVTREYRVNSVNGNEDTAYYTDDLDDAVGTALMIRKTYLEALDRRKEQR